MMEGLIKDKTISSLNYTSSNRQGDIDESRLTLQSLPIGLPLSSVNCETVSIVHFRDHFL